MIDNIKQLSTEELLTALEAADEHMYALWGDGIAWSVQTEDTIYAIEEELSERNNANLHNSQI